MAVFISADCVRSKPVQTEHTSLEMNRLEKMESLRAKGIEPYPTRAMRTHTSLDAIRLLEAAEAAPVVEGIQPQPTRVLLAGRLRSMRPMGKITFAHIEDGEVASSYFFRANDIGQEQL
jgi:lysyl-tRNA synthetase class 2